MENAGIENVKGVPVILFSIFHFPFSLYLCFVEKNELIKAFVCLGKIFRLLGDNEAWPGYGPGVSEDEYNQLQAVIRKEQQLNPWFTESSVRSALKGLAAMLETPRFTEWADSYSFTTSPKKVLIVMAGNIPMVGFHDFMCVLLSGNIAVCKLSSSDQRLLPSFAALLKLWCPEAGERIRFAPGPVKEIDAVIATGSNNSVGQFQSYFGHYPHVFRRNRTSVAVLDGTETKEELALLGNDMFDYFGLGCRNVSRIFVPQDFELNRLFEAIVDKGDIVNHHKYANNYDYNRTIYLMNQVPFLDNNFMILKEEKGLFSPLSVVYYQRYSDMSEVNAFLDEQEMNIQTVVGHGFNAFGSSQCPAVDDYADNVDTMQWLNELS
jgi:hypothetical protein